MTILVTGAAGFIGYHLCTALLADGRQVIGWDNLNDYYDPALKQARLDRLGGKTGFDFRKIDIASRTLADDQAGDLKNVTHIVHLAAQAGVRYSLENPYAYVDANLMGQVAMLELARRLPNLEHFTFASSSSVYGANARLPFSVDDPADDPVSLYAATKRSGELIASTYSRLYGLKVTGLRFFTVYGPWGRPDMAYFSFVKAAFEGTPVRIFNHGRMRRDFTYIDDIVAGIAGALNCPHAPDASPPSRLYNLGNHHAVELGAFIAEIEKATGRTLKKIDVEMQKGDVQATYADIDGSRHDFGFEPRTSIHEGIPKFVEWYRAFYGMNI